MEAACSSRCALRPACTLLFGMRPEADTVHGAQDASGNAAKSGIKKGDTVYGPAPCTQAECFCCTVLRMRAAAGCTPRASLGMSCGPQTRWAPCALPWWLRPPQSASCM